MANEKISAFNTVEDGQGTKPDVRKLKGIAGYEELTIGSGVYTNAQMSGEELVESIINQGSAAQGRISFYGAGSGGQTSLGGSSGLSWDQTTDTLNIGTPNSGAGLEADVRLHGTYVTGDGQPSLSFYFGDSSISTTPNIFTIITDKTGADQVWVLPAELPDVNDALVALDVDQEEVTLGWATNFDTQYTFSAEQSTVGSNESPDLKLGWEDSTGTLQGYLIQLSGGTNITTERSTTGDEITINATPTGLTGQIQFASSTNTFNADSALFYTIANNVGNLSVGDVGITQGRLNLYGGATTSGSINISDPNDDGITIKLPNDMGGVNYDVILPEIAPTNSQILESDASGNLSWIDTPTSAGASAFTPKAGADVIDWDYATDGPNLRLNLGSGLENVLTVNNITDFPNGSTGFVIMNPQNSTDYKMPSEDYGSASGITSKLSGGDASLGGTNNVLWEWTYDGANFYWQKFQNYVNPIYPPSVVFDSTSLIAFYHPESYNESVNGASLIAGTPVTNIATSILIGNLAVGSNVTNAEFYTRDDSVSRPAFWSLGGDSNSIISPSTFSGLPVTNTVSCYIQGPFASSYSTIFDFDEGSGYQELLYINSSREFEFDYSPALSLNYPALIDYSGNVGGADLSNEWIFISVSLDDANNEVIFYAGCQSSLDAATAAGGPTNWDYDGLGNTIAVDANGLYKETNAFTIGTNTFNRFFYGQSVGSVSEGAKCHLGMLGIYSAVLNDSQVTQNWLDSRGVYYII